MSSAAHCGAAKGQLETLKLLSAAGADLWRRNVRGEIPLHDAVQSGRRELVRWLLGLRPDMITVANSDGRSGLHIAAATNNVEMCRVSHDPRNLVNLNRIVQITALSNLRETALNGAKIAPCFHRRVGSLIYVYF